MKEPGKNVINLIGNKYGRLLVVEYAGNTKHGSALWNCVCDCNNIFIAIAGSLKSGNTKSCGCLRKDKIYRRGFIPSKAIIKDGIATIEICDKKNKIIAHAIVDEIDYDKVKDFRWSLSGNRYVAARMTHGDNTRIYLHRLLLNTKKVHTDHINGDRLDNRRNNLRECTHAENFHNQSKRQTYAGRPTTSIYKGVCLANGKWVAQIGVDKKRIRLGSYVNEEEAGLAYNKAALKYFGEFARINEI